MESKRTRELREALKVSEESDKRRLRLWAMNVLNTMTQEEHFEILRVLRNHYPSEDESDRQNPFDLTPPKPGEHGICQFDDGKCQICGLTSDDEFIDI